MPRMVNARLSHTTPALICMSYESLPSVAGEAPCLPLSAALALSTWWLLNLSQAVSKAPACWVPEFHCLSLSEFSFCLALLCLLCSHYFPSGGFALAWTRISFLSLLWEVFHRLISKASVVLVPACSLSFVHSGFHLTSLNISLSGSSDILPLHPGSLVTWSQINRLHPTRKHTLKKQI